MNLVGMLFFMALIGALIGGFTNFLAIKMLFRPYRPLYLGKWKLPFTPGLIPKRHGELATQIGRIVEEYLLTPESIEKKFNELDFQNHITALLQQEAKPLIHSERTVRDVLEAVAVENPELKTTQWVEKFIDKKYREFKSNYINLSIKETLPPEWQSKVEGKIPEVSTYILNKGIDYFSSVEGKQRVRRMIDDFLAEWGKLGNMLQMVLGNTSLADKVQPEIIKFLRNEGTKDLIDSVLMKEWEKILDWKWEYVFEQLSDEKVVEKGKAFLINQLNIPAIYSKPVSQVLEPFGEKIIHEVIPKAVDRGGRFIATRIPAIMGKLRIGDIVRQQVEEFSLERLEQMVLEISYKELKMITYLGALLGGVIGLIQGGIVTLFQ